jgi:hypothetical protein
MLVRFPSIIWDVAKPPVYPRKLVSTCNGDLSTKKKKRKKEEETIPCTTRTPESNAQHQYSGIYSGID